MNQLTAWRNLALSGSLNLVPCNSMFGIFEKNNISSVYYLPSP